MSHLSAKDQTAITQLWTQYAAAFDAKNAPAIADLYTPDGDLIGVEGDLVTGPRAVEAYYVDRFSVIPMAKVRDAKISPARIVDGNAALVNGSWRVAGVGPQPVDVVGSFVLRQDRGRWSYVAVRFLKPFPVP